jgi:hypothetical protein
VGETLTFTVGIYKKLWNLFSAAGQGRLRALKYGSEEKGSSLYKCSPLLGFFMSKKL